MDEMIERLMKYDTEGIPFAKILALIQIACKDCVYLVDPLAEDIDESKWLELAEIIFG